MDIHQLEKKDKDKFFQHLMNIHEYNGKRGQILHSPNPLPPNQTKFLEDYDESISGSNPRWVVFGLFDGNNIIGHVDLHSPPRKESFHRRSLGMAIEPQAQSMGYGKKLLSKAIAHAKHLDLEYIDLFVFTDNKKAINLYKKFGFQLLGVRKDRFRVHGKSVDDNIMALKLKEKKCL